MKGFTLIEFIVVISIIAILAALVFGPTDAEKHAKCMEVSTHVPEDERSQYCINKEVEESRNTAILLSN